MTLRTAETGKEYIIQRIDTDDEELNAFLFSLGCYSGEPITVVSRRRGSCVVSIKDGRYNIDEQLAEAGIPVDLIRMSVGIEAPEDIIADIEQAMVEAYK